MKAGVREVREKLSKYLQRVTDRRQEVIITDRGRPVARLAPVGDRVARLHSRKGLRAAIRPRGIPMSRLVGDARDEERS